MEPVSTDHHIPCRSADPTASSDRPVRLFTRFIRSPWTAMFFVAFAVSYAFHQVDIIQRHRIERQQQVLSCTIQEIADRQSMLPIGVRVKVKPILDRCVKQEGK